MKTIDTEFYILKATEVIDSDKVAKTLYDSGFIILPYLGMKLYNIGFAIPKLRIGAVMKDMGFPHKDVVYTSFKTDLVKNRSLTVYCKEAYRPGEARFLISKVLAELDISIPELYKSFWKPRAEE